MKNKLKYIISTMLVVLLTAFFVKVPDWYYALTDSSLQSDYGIQEVEISTNTITPKQFFTLMRSGSATQMQINNMDSSQVKEGLSKSIKNMKDYMEEHDIIFTAEFLSYLLSLMTDNDKAESFYDLQSVTGIADNELLSTVVCVVGSQFPEGYTVTLVFDCNTNVIYAMNFGFPFQLMEYTDNEAWLEFQKALSAYWNISEEELWWDMYDAEAETDQTLLYLNINADITDMFFGMSNVISEMAVQ